MLRERENKRKKITERKQGEGEKKKKWGSILVEKTVREKKEQTANKK